MLSQPPLMPFIEYLEQRVHLSVSTDAAGVPAPQPAPVSTAVSATATTNPTSAGSSQSGFIGDSVNYVAGSTAAAPVATTSLIDGSLTSTHQSTLTGTRAGLATVNTYSSGSGSNTTPASVATGTATLNAESIFSSVSLSNSNLAATDTAQSPLVQLVGL